MLKRERLDGMNITSPLEKKKKIRKYIDPTQYYSWSRDEIVSVLMSPINSGGASLGDMNRLKPFLNSLDFQPDCIYNIMESLKSNNNNGCDYKLELTKQLQQSFKDSSKATCYSIVRWVERLSKRLYNEWKHEDMERIIQYEMQIDMTTKANNLDLRSFKRIIKNSIHSKEFDESMTSSISSDIIEKIREWSLSNIFILIDSPIISSFHETPSLLTKEFKQDSITWLDQCLNKSLSKCFNELLDQPFNLISHKDTIMGFYSRDEFKSNIKHLVKSNISHYWKNKQGPIERVSDFYYGIISNGTGNGKTRACKEIQNIILNMELPYFRKLHCYFPFTNSFSLNSTEINNPYRNNDGKILGIRFLCHIYGIDVNSLKNAFGSNFKTLLYETNIFSFDNIIKLLGSFLRNGENLLLSLAIDEIQELQDLKLENWIEPTYCIGNFMVDQLKKNPNLESNVCAVPILSGISSNLINKATRYGNMLLSLPPINSCNVGNLVMKFYEQWKFKCETPMTKLFESELESNNTTNILLLLIYEALLIPNVLKITLNTIGNTLSENTFEEWKINSTIISFKIKLNVEEKVNEYLPSFTGNSLILEKILTCERIDLTSISNNNLKRKLFNDGLLYVTRFNTLYIASHYFKQLIINDSYISEKLPKSSFTNISHSNLEQIDLKCILYRIRNTAIKYIKLDELFPGCISSISNDSLFQSVHSNNYSIINCEQNPFIVNNDNNTLIISNDIKTDIGSVYFYNNNTTNHCGVNGHVCLFDPFGNRTIFLIHYKFNNSHSNNLDPNDWLNNIDFTKQVIDAFKEMKLSVMFVYITTKTIPSNFLTKLQESSYYNRFILIHNDNTLNESLNPVQRYFPPNLLPYYMMMLSINNNNQ